MGNRTRQKIFENLEKLQIFKKKKFHLLGITCASQKKTYWSPPPTSSTVKLSGEQ